MVELLDRSLSQGGIEELARTEGAGPPKEMPDVERFVRPRWPRSAKILVAALAVLAIAGAFGTAVQIFDDDAVPDYQAQVSELTEQRNQLLVENVRLSASKTQLEAGNTQLAADNTQLAADNTQLAADNAQLEAGNRQLAADNAQLDAESDAVSADLATVQADNSIMSNALALATAEVGDLTNQVSELQSTNDAVAAERDALAVMFPMLVNTSLVGVDVTGTYAVKWFPAYNSGLANISLPRVAQVVISHTEEGWPQVDIPGVVTAGLFGTDGALSTMVDTTTAVPPVDGIVRTARVAITIYAGDTVTAQDGTTTVNELGMSITIATPAVGSAPAGVALYGAGLTPQS